MSRINYRTAEIKEITKKEGFVAFKLLVDRGFSEWSDKEIEAVMSLRKFHKQFKVGDFVKFIADKPKVMFKIPSSNVCYTEFDALANKMNQMTCDEIIAVHEKLKGHMYKSRDEEKSFYDMFVSRAIDKDYGFTIPKDVERSVIEFLNSEHISDYIKNWIRETLEPKIKTHELSRQQAKLNTIDIALNSKRTISEFTAHEFDLICKVLKQAAPYAGYKIIGLAFKLDSKGANEFLNEKVDPHLVIERILGTSGLNPRPEYYSGRGANCGDMNGKHLIAIYQKLMKLDENKAIKMIEMTMNMPTLGATEFIESIFNLARNNYDLDKTEVSTNNNSLGNARGKEMEVIATCIIASAFGGPRSDETSQIKRQFAELLEARIVDDLVSGSVRRISKIKNKNLLSVEDVDLKVERYLSNENIEFLLERANKLVEERESIIQKAYTILNENSHSISLKSVTEVKQYLILIEHLYDRTACRDESGEVHSVDNMLQKMRENGFDENASWKLREIAYKVSEIGRNLEKSDYAILLPSKATLDASVTSEKTRVISKAKAAEVEKPTNLSTFQEMVKYNKFEDLEPYAKLWQFFEGLPFSLDPKDPRYISLSDNFMMRGEDTKMFNHYKVEGPWAYGTDIIREMRTWSDTYRTSVQMKRLLCFQQYMEGQFEKWGKTRKELEADKHIETDCEYIRETANAVYEATGEERTRLLTEFYRTIDSQYGNMYGFANDLAMFIDVYLDPTKSFGHRMPDIGCPTRTALEEAYLQIADERFEDTFIGIKHGIPTSNVDDLVKTKKI